MTTSIITLATELDKFKRAATHLDGRLSADHAAQFRTELIAHLRNLNEWLTRWQIHIGVRMMTGDTVTTMTEAWTLPVTTTYDDAPTYSPPAEAPDTNSYSSDSSSRKDGMANYTYPARVQPKNSNAR
jgi:hypothetical protein